MTIIEPGNRLLSRAEPEASAVIRSVFEDDGIRVLTQRRPIKVHHTATSGSALFKVDLATGQQIGLYEPILPGE